MTGVQTCALPICFSIVKGGSKCFLCGHKLKWFELIPVLSFIAQKGRCRECGAKISYQYPLVEFLTGLIFLLVFSSQLSALSKTINPYFLLSTFYFLTIFSLLIIIAVYDLRHKIIPSGIVYTFCILTFLNLFRLPEWLGQAGISDFGFRIFNNDSFWAGIIFASFFAILWLASGFVFVGIKNGLIKFKSENIGTWMGLGDAKLALGIGWLLGSEKTLVAALMAFWIGAIVGLGIMFLKKNKYNLKSQIAFGPFLVIGTIIAFFWGETLIKFILHI